jgi:hypothetical protein
MIQIVPNLDRCPVVVIRYILDADVPCDLAAAMPADRPIRVIDLDYPFADKVRDHRDMAMHHASGVIEHKHGFPRRRLAAAIMS